ncbi:hypothetical protein L1987_17827 [Smallanthus sonchifolius]|uniref:Uncharacterized protein n=1 Tax=Smallanthus sonchifolius TaxID=185202 RepID=A0ACB9IZ25_9ASTR|nr:hypothetical protein L1987_17827 [Smallanthus sonchifolius]
MNERRNAQIAENKSVVEQKAGSSGVPKYANKTSPMPHRSPPPQHTTIGLHIMPAKLIPAPYHAGEPVHVSFSSEVDSGSI